MEGGADATLRKQTLPAVRCAWRAIEAIRARPSATGRVPLQMVAKRLAFDFLLGEDDVLLARFGSGSRSRLVAAGKNIDFGCVGPAEPVVDMKMIAGDG